MKTLKQILAVVNRKRISKVDIFDKTLLSSKESKFTQFYEAIESGEVEEDSDASLLLYGKPNSASYRKLKQRFLARLLNTLFFLDLNNSAGKVDYKYAHYSCMKALMHAKLLRFFGAFGAAASILKQRYNDAKKYHFYDILTEYSNFLLQYYSLSGNTKMMNEEKDNFIKYKGISDSESLGEVVYYSSIVEFAKTGAITEIALFNLRKGIIDIEEIVRDYPTVVNVYCKQLLTMILCEALYDYPGLLKECDKTYEILKEHTYFNDHSKIGLVTRRKLVACLNVKDFEQGLKLYNETANLFTVGSINWLNLKKYGALLAFHSKNRETAYRIYLEGINNKRAKSMTQKAKEFWAIFGAYCQFLLRVHNEMDQVENFEELKKFRLYKFLNEVPIYSKDKSGYNVSLLIIKYIFSLLDAKYGDIINSVDSLKVYRSRYLKDIENKRAYTFIGMLLKLEKEGFVSKNAIIKCKDDFDLLINNGFNSANKDSENWPVHDWEVIPFEHLWEYIIKILTFNELSDSLKVSRSIIE